MKKLTPTLITSLSVFLLALPAFGPADAASSTLTFRTNPRLHPQVNPAFQPSMQCLVDKLEAQGVKVVNYRGYGTACYGSRAFSRSLHFRGLACDVMQKSRDLTLLTQYMAKSAINQLAASCNVVSGGIWPGPPRPPSHGSDLGHFQIRSASRSVQSQRVRQRTRSYYYPRYYYPGSSGYYYYY